MQNPASSTVLQQEVDRRLREYRAKGFEQRVMPHIIFRPRYILCPWPHCDHSIAGIDFQLELMGDQSDYEQLMQAWWKGAGLVGRCPGCTNYVLFTMQDKQRVESPGEHGSAVMPDDWHERAFFLS